MSLFSYFAFIDGILLVAITIKMYSVYQIKKSKGYIYYAAFFFLLGITLFVLGLPGVFIHNALIINNFSSVVYSIGPFISIALLTRIKFYWLKKPVLGEIVFWMLVLFSVVSLFSNIFSHGEAVKFEDHISGIPALIYWLPNLTLMTNILLCAAVLLSLWSFPYHMLLLTMETITTKAGRMRAFLMIAGMVIAGLGGIAFFIFQIHPMPYMALLISIISFWVSFGVVLPLVLSRL